MMKIELVYTCLVSPVTRVLGYEYWQAYMYMYMYMYIMCFSFSIYL